MDEHLEIAARLFPIFGKFGNFEKHVWAVATPLGCIDSHIKYGQVSNSSQLRRWRYLRASLAFECAPCRERGMLQDLLTSTAAVSEFLG